MAIFSLPFAEMRDGTVTGEVWESFGMFAPFLSVDVRKPDRRREGRTVNYSSQLSAFSYQRRIDVWLRADGGELKAMPFLPARSTALRAWPSGSGRRDRRNPRDG